MTTKFVDSAKVLAVTGGTVTIVNSNIEPMIMAESLKVTLSIISLSLAIGYTIWKWSNDVRKKRANIKKYYEEKNKE